MAKIEQPAPAIHDFPPPFRFGEVEPPGIEGQAVFMVRVMTPIVILAAAPVVLIPPAGVAIPIALIAIGLFSKPFTSFAIPVATTRILAASVPIIVGARAVLSFSVTVARGPLVGTSPVFVSRLGGVGSALGIRTGVSSPIEVLNGVSVIASHRTYLIRAMIAVAASLVAIKDLRHETFIARIAHDDQVAGVRFRLKFDVDGGLGFALGLRLRVEYGGRRGAPVALSAVAISPNVNLDARAARADGDAPDHTGARIDVPPVSEKTINLITRPSLGPRGRAAQ
jgi:hypothetical protein